MVRKFYVQLILCPRFERLLNNPHSVKTNSLYFLQNGLARMDGTTFSGPMISSSNSGIPTNINGSTHSKNPVLILGATSDIAIHIAHGLARRGFPLYLTGRDMERLDGLTKSLEPTGVSISTFAFDASDFASHQKFYNSLPVPPSIVISCIGYYEDQNEARLDHRESVMTMNVNLTGLITILNTISNDFEKRRSGSIVVLSSVAGERGRQLNYIYGAAKSGMTTYLSGLRNRMHRFGVTVTTIKLGPVYTRMSEGHNLMPILTLSPEVAAEKIIRASLKKKDVVFIYWPWRIIMFLIRMIPEWIFKRLPPF